MARSVVAVALASATAVFGLGLEQLGDAEVQQLHRAVGGHEDVVGLEIAMHDEVLVRVAHGCADLQEELHAVAHAEVPRIAPGVDGLAGHELHDHVRHAAIGGSAIEQPRDVAVVEPRENLPLRAETLFGQAAAHVGAHELDGDFRAGTGRRRDSP